MAKKEATAAAVPGTKLRVKKGEKEECLKFVVAEIEEMQSWLGSAVARFKHHKDPLPKMLTDISGAKTAVVCGYRDAVAKFPAVVRPEPHNLGNLSIELNTKTVAEYKALISSKRKTTPEDVLKAAGVLYSMSRVLESMSLDLRRPAELAAVDWDEMRKQLK